MCFHIFYRISDSGYIKQKPSYITNSNCLLNALTAFPLKSHQWKIIADGVGEETRSLLKACGLHFYTEYTAIGNGAGTYLKHLEKAICLPSNDVVYFLEDDYIHQLTAANALREGSMLPVDYWTLYDHPDKYMSYQSGGNPFCINQGEECIVYNPGMYWWRTTNSTTMSFAAKVKTLKQDFIQIKGFVDGTHPEDFKLWLSLRSAGRKLVSPMPSVSTHGETLLLAREHHLPNTWEQLATMIQIPGHSEDRSLD